MTTVSSATSKRPINSGLPPFRQVGIITFQMASTVITKESSARTPPGPANRMSSSAKKRASTHSQVIR